MQSKQLFAECAEKGKRVKSKVKSEKVKMRNCSATVQDRVAEGFTVTRNSQPITHNL